ncbi:MAG: hypothetical protein JNN15_20150, partial [Blastocatellia bacterium]|nr:hypothetical protein [Blastocatellia bacterium]
MSKSAILCKECLKWLCASRDLFCAYCGTGLVKIILSVDKIELGSGISTFSILNRGVIDLYWACEIVSPNNEISKIFELFPDYGVLSSGQEQLLSINLKETLSQKLLRISVEV